MVCLGIPRAVQQSHAMQFRFVKDPVELACGRIKFGSVALAEDAEALGLMPKPLSKLLAWGELFEPPIQLSAGFGDPSGPQAIDQIPSTVAAVDGFVDALQG